MDYLQLVSNDRRGAQVRQKVLASLGRLDEIRADGALNRLVGTGAALSGKALYLAPPSHGARPELVRDESLPAMILGMLESVRPVADILSSFCASDPAGLRGLVATATFAGLDSAACLPRGLQLLHGLGARSDQEKKQVVTFASLAQASTRPEDGERADADELIVSIRPAATSGAPSIARGLVTFLVVTTRGLPLAAGHWPAHLPPLKLASDLAAQIGRRLGVEAPVIVFDRSFASDAFLSALGKLALDFIVPLREVGVGSAMRGAWENWTCNETRAPRREAGAEGPDLAAATPGLRFIQMVDSAAAERDWRLRNAQMERLRRISVATGANSPNAARLHAAHHSLQEAQRWDGVTLVATNLGHNPDETARAYAAATAIRTWEAELTAFGRVLLDLGAPPRDAEALLTGGVSVALVSAFLRNALADMLSERLGRHCGWQEISEALLEHRAVRLVQGNRDVTIPFETPPALAALLEALGVSAQSTGRRQGGTRPIRRRRMQATG